MEFFLCDIAELIKKLIEYKFLNEYSEIILDLRHFVLNEVPPVLLLL